MTDLSVDLFRELHVRLAEQRSKSIDEARRCAKATLDPRSATEGEVFAQPTELQRRAFDLLEIDPAKFLP